MAKNKGYRVPATVVTMDTKDKYPVVDGNDVSGSYHIYTNEVDKFSIPKLRRKLGMLVYITSTGTMWKLINDPTTDFTNLPDWEEVKILTKKEFDDVQKGPKNTVVAVQRLDVIKVPYNTNISAIALPIAVNVTLGDGSSATYPVVWNTTTYNPVDSGMQIINGDLTLPSGVLNSLVNITQHILVGAETHIIATLLDPTPLDTLTPAYGTAFSDLKLPNQVKVKYVDGTTGILSVDWSGSKAGYNPTSTGSQTLIGDLILPSNVSQPVSGDIHPSIDIAAMTVPLQIVSDNPIPDLPDVVEGTAYTSLTLPATNIVTLSDGSTDTLKIKWLPYSYNPTYIGKQVITGEYVVPSKYLNDANVYPKVNITVETIPDVISVDDCGPVNVAAGTPLSSIVFPTTTKAKLLYYDGSTKDITVPVTWNTASAGYDPVLGGDYYFDGTITLPPNTTNITNIQPQFHVKLAPTITYFVGSVSPLSQTVANGTLESTITKPSTVAITIEGTDGSKVNGTASVVWDTASTPAYNATTPGLYVYYGVITPIGSSAPNSKGLKATYTVDVQPVALPTTYTVSGWTPDTSNSSVTCTENDLLATITSVPPTTLQVTYKGSNGTTATVPANITWNFAPVSDDGVSVRTLGYDYSYTIYGTIDLTSAGFPAGITNPSPVTPTYTVYVTKKTSASTSHDIVDSVTSTLPDISIPYDTNKANGITLVNNQLSNTIYSLVDIQAKKPTGAYYPRTNVSVTSWKVSNVDCSVSDATYIVTGTLANLESSDNIYNDNNVPVVVMVRIGSAPITKTITSFVTPTVINVPYGTALADIGLDKTITMNITTNGVVGSTPVNVTWNTSKYNPTLAGTYKFTCTVSTDLSQFTNASDVGTTIPLPVYTVEVVAPPVTYSVKSMVTDPLGTITLTEGDPIGSLISALPATADVIYTDSNGSPDKTVTANITWATSTISSNGSTININGVDVTYTAKGTIDLTSAGFPSGITNPLGVTANYTVVVKAKAVPTTYTVVTAPAIQYASATEGDLLSTLTFKSPQDIQYIASTDPSNKITAAANIIWTGATASITSDGTTIITTGSNKTYTLTGTIDLTTPGLPAGITNPSGYTAQLQLSVTAKTVAPTSKNEIDSQVTDVTVAVKYGATEADVIAALSAFPTVDITYKNDSVSATKTGVAVTWTTSNWAASGFATAPGSHIISGAYADLTSDGIYNDTGKVPTATVIVGKAPDVKKITSYVGVPFAKSVSFGTAASDLALESTITANITVNGTPSTTTFNVTWAEDTSKPYNGNVADTYSFICTITDDLSDYSSKPASNPTYAITVNPKPAPASKGYSFSVNYTMPTPATSMITVNNLSDLSAIYALGNDAEDAFNGVWSDSADAFDNSQRVAEVRFLGTPANPITDHGITSSGIRVPCDSSTDTERTAFQNKLQELGYDGVCGSVASPISYTFTINTNESDSGIEFNAALDQSPIFLIRMCDPSSGYIPVPDTENSVV